jgi:hypothetical protein
MPVLTDLASAEVKRNVRILYGTTLTRPTLLLSDGLNTQYVVDVNVGELDPTGQINQYIDEKAKKKDGKPPGSLLTGLPGQAPEDWQLDDSLPGHVDTTIHNVPLARNNTELRYADVGAPVVLTRSDSTSQWEVTGFSIEQPGTHHLYPVDLSDMTIGTVIDLSVTTKLLTLAEFGELPPGGFGALALGASAIYKGSDLVRVV